MRYCAIDDVQCVYGCVCECVGVLILHACIGLIVCLLSDRLTFRTLSQTTVVIRIANCAFSHVVTDILCNVFFYVTQ